MGTDLKIWQLTFLLKTQDKSAMRKKSKIVISRETAEFSTQIRNCFTRVLANSGLAT